MGVVEKELNFFLEGSSSALSEHPCLLCCVGRLVAPAGVRGGDVVRWPGYRLEFRVVDPGAPGEVLVVMFRD